MGINTTYEGFENLELLLAERLIGFARWIKNFVIAGFNVISGGGLNVTIGDTTQASYAYIDGYEIVATGQTTKLLTDNATNYIFLCFTKNSDSIAGVASIVPSITVNTTGTPPDNSLLLATVICAAAAITSITPADTKFDLHDAKLTTNLDCNQHELQEEVSHKGTAFPSSPVVGQRFYRTDADKLYVRTGSGWVALH